MHYNTDMIKHGMIFLKPANQVGDGQMAGELLTRSKQTAGANHLSPDQRPYEHVCASIELWLWQ